MNHQDTLFTAQPTRSPVTVSVVSLQDDNDANQHEVEASIPQGVDLGQGEAVPHTLLPPAAAAYHELPQNAAFQADRELALQLMQLELERQQHDGVADHASEVSLSGPHSPSQYSKFKFGLRDKIAFNTIIPRCNLLLLVVPCVSLGATVATGPSSSTSGAGSVTRPPQCGWILPINAAMVGIQCLYFALLMLKSWLSIRYWRVQRHNLYHPRRLKRLRQGVAVMYYSVFGMQFAMFCTTIALLTPVISTFHSSCPHVPFPALPLTLTWVALMGAFLVPVAALSILGAGYILWIMVHAVWQWSVDRLVLSWK